MKKALLAICVMCCLWSKCGIAAPKALVIGNDAYAGHELQNARNDATSVASSLQALGYETTLYLDVASSAMKVAIDRFAANLRRGDTVVFYYAGHGFQLNGENYLVPTDFAVGDPEQAREQGYPLYSLLRRFTDHGATTQIIVLDSCRDNPFLKSRSMSKGWSALPTSAGTFLAFGTSPGSTANDDPQENHGLFTKFVLQHLGDTSSDIEKMFKDVRRDVISASRGSQVPWTESSLIGSICLAKVGASENKASKDEGNNVKEVPVRALENARSMVVNERNSPSESTTTFNASAVPLQAVQIVREAQDAMRTGRVEDSIATLKRGISWFPSCATILKMLGIALAIAGRDVEADATLERALSAEPQDAMVPVYRCIVKTGTDVFNAKSLCNRAIASVPGSEAAHLAMADFLLSSGQPVRALAEATTALDIQPTDSLAFALRGKIFKSMGEFGSANSDFEQASKLATVD
jgi:Flp pilus assembly protein TadD